MNLKHRLPSGAASGTRPFVAVLALLAACAAGTVTAQTPAAPQDTAVRMNPFEVSSDKDSGFQSANMGSGSRLAIELKDAPVPYSVINREFIDALGINDLREAAAWATGNTYYNTDNGSDSRSLSSQYFSRGALTSQGGADSFGAQRNFYQNSSISSDSYAVETYDFGRGPNAALFGQGAGTGGDAGNGGLSGVSSTQTKRARFDRGSTTIGVELGQYDYRRGTIDINRPINEKFSVRINAVDLDREDWRMLDMQTTRGLSFAATYKINPSGEIRLDASNEKRQSHTIGSGWDEFLSGWDGRTVFRGAITNSMRSTTATPGVTTVANASYGSLNTFGNSGLIFSGEDAGVDRLGQQLWYNQYDGTVMNYQNFPLTRRTDSTSRVPVWSATAPNGQFYQRATMPLQGNGQIQPSFGFGRSFFAKYAFPADIFDRQIKNSRLHFPSERWQGSLDTPTTEQVSRDLQLTWSQRLSSKLFLEIGGDANRNFNTNRNIDDPNPGGRSAYIDLSMIRPDGSPNDHFLEPYTTIPLVRSLNWTQDQTLRANLAYVLDIGAWGNYAFNAQGSMSQRKSKTQSAVVSLKRNADPRNWNQASDQLRLTSYWYDMDRAYTVPVDGASVVFTDVVWDAANNNPVVQSPQVIQPSWVLNNWSENFVKTNYVLGQTTAKYWRNKLVFTGAARRDLRVGISKASLNRGDLPITWDSNSPIYRPDAPADYFTMTYIQRNASTGLPVTGKPILSGNRPRTTIAGVQNQRDPLYINERFRDDYNNPKSRSYGNTYSVGAVWHATSWISPGVNFSNTYTPSTSATLDMSGEVREALSAKAAEYSATVTLLKGKMSVKWNYFDNVRQNDNFNPNTLGFINTLYAANRFDDPDTTASGRNVRGAVALPGQDYADKRNYGYEMEVAMSVSQNFRLSANGSVTAHNNQSQGRLTRAYVPENADLFRAILEDAGGRLDTSVKNPNAPSAPGTAFVNTAIAGATADQTAAVDAYNNLWTSYESLLGTRIQDTPNQPTINIFADYSIPSGILRGLRFGAGIQWQGRAPNGNHGADTILDPTNPIPTAVDDPRYNNFDYSYGKGDYNTQANVSYRFALKSGNTLSLALRINNVLNHRTPVVGTDGGFSGIDFFQGGNTVRQSMLTPQRETGNRVIAHFTPPINFRISATYQFSNGR